MSCFVAAVCTTRDRLCFVTTLTFPVRCQNNLKIAQKKPEDWLLSILFPSFADKAPINADVNVVPGSNGSDIEVAIYEVIFP